MPHHTEYQFERGNPVAGLLELIERCAPKFMRCGDGGEQMAAVRGNVTPDEQRRIETAVLHGTPRKVIAEEMNLSFGTVCRRTRHLRGKEGTAA